MRAPDLQIDELSIRLTGISPEAAHRLAHQLGHALGQQLPHVGHDLELGALELRLPATPGSADPTALARAIVRGIERTAP